MHSHSLLACVLLALLVLRTVCVGAGEFETQNGLQVSVATKTISRDAAYQRKDKLEFKVTVTHGGSLTAEVVSTPAFEALARNAQRPAPPGEE